MAVPPNDKTLLITGKGKKGTISGTDARTIEQWGLGVGFIKKIASTDGTVTIVDDEGPIVDLSASGGGGGGYDSLTGPGQTATPGDLTQMGGFLVQFGLGHAFEVSDGAVVFSIGSNNAIVLGHTGDPSITFTNLEIVLDDAAGDTITLQHGVGATITGSVRIQSVVGTTINVDSSGGASILGFYGVTPVPRAAHPTVLSDVITLLTNLGLCH